MREFPSHVTQEGAVHTVNTTCKEAIYVVAEFYELFSLDEITNKVRVYSPEWVALHVSRACRTCAAVLHAGEGHEGLTIGIIPRGWNRGKYH